MFEIRIYYQYDIVTEQTQISNIILINQFIALFQIVKLIKKNIYCAILKIIY